MANSVKKLLGWKPSGKIMVAVSVFIIMIIIIPLIVLCRYAVPWYDDYNYGVFVKHAYEENHTILGALMGSIGSARTQWYAWQGTFSSIFFMGLTPILWGEAMYFLGPLFLVINLFLSTFLFIGVLLRQLFKCDKMISYVIQSVTSALILLQLYSSQEGLYWYNSGIHYVGMHSFLLLGIAAGIFSFGKKGWLDNIFLVLSTVLCAVLAGGSNFVTSLQGILLFCMVFIFALLASWRKALLYLPSIGVYAYCFYMNVSAPGNSVRASYFVGAGMAPLKAIFYSFIEAFRHMWEFSGAFMVIVMIMMIPVIWRMLAQTEFSFKYPAVVLVISVCLYATGFTPSLYSLGHAGLPRTLNVVKITFQLLLIIDEIYLVGWIREKYYEKINAVMGRLDNFGFYLLMIVILAGVFCVEPNKVGKYSSYGAFTYVCTGEAEDFHNEYMERVRQLKSEDKNIVFEPYSVRPWMLCVDDLSDNYMAGPNKGMANWYNKESVICSVDK